MLSFIRMGMTDGNTPKFLKSSHQAWPSHFSFCPISKVQEVEAAQSRIPALPCKKLARAVALSHFWKIKPKLSQIGPTKLKTILFHFSLRNLCDRLLSAPGYKNTSLSVKNAQSSKSLHAAENSKHQFTSISRVSHKRKESWSLDYDPALPTPRWCPSHYPDIHAHPFISVSVP